MAFLTTDITEAVGDKRENSRLLCVATERGERVKTEFVSGILIGVRDGPIIVIEVIGREKKLPLDCEVSIGWAFSRMNTRVVCVVEDGRVIRVE